MFVSTKNKCLIVTNFTLVNLNLSSVTCSGVSHIWTENEKVWWDKLYRPFLTIAPKLLKSELKWIFFSWSHSYDSVCLLFPLFENMSSFANLSEKWVMVNAKIKKSTESALELTSLHEIIFPGTGSGPKYNTTIKEGRIFLPKLLHVLMIKFYQSINLCSPRYD